jgi:hypothetical protein
MTSFENIQANHSKTQAGYQEQRKYVMNVSEEVNRQIDQQLQIIAKTILKSTRILGYELGIKSILIAGGFGKGEGSIKLTDSGKAICRRDFDLVCIVDRKPSSKVANKIEDQIYSSLGIPNPTSSDFERGQSFAIDLLFLRKNDLIYPDIKFYDLKAASQVLWGEDIRSLNPWTKKDVPISSGLRLLFEKVTGLLGYFNINYIESEEPTSEAKDYLLSECHKTFIEIGSALCILAEKYEPKFSQRAQILQSFYSAKFPRLSQVLPELPEKVLEYTYLRLHPGSLHIEEDPINLWFITRHYLKETLKFYVEIYAGKKISDWNNFPKLMKVIASEYYKPLLGPFLRNRLHLVNSYLIHLASFLYQGLTNLEYSYITTSKREGNPLKPLQSWSVSPSLKYFTAGALLLFSLHRDGSVERVMLKTAQKVLDKCVYSDIDSFDKRGWEELRIRFLKARNLYRGFHFVK